MEKLCQDGVETRPWSFRKLEAVQNIPPPPLAPPILQGSHMSPLQILEEEKGGQIMDKAYCTSVEQESLKAHSIFLQNKGLQPDAECSDLIFLSCYQPVIPVIQNGPLCGMVALAMASQTAEFKTTMTEDIFMEAKCKGFSLQGEIFSASFLKDLAMHYLDCDVEHIWISKDEATGQMNGQRIITSLILQNLILMPYDADKNHSPCLKKGHKAHWALLTGFFIGFSSSSVPDWLLPMCEKSTEIPSLYFLPAKHSLVLQKELISHLEISSQNVYVFAHHGKSKHVGVWPLSSLLLSNDNLVEAGPERGETEYILPPGGLSEGLKGQALVIRKV